MRSFIIILLSCINTSLFAQRENSKQDFGKHIISFSPLQVIGFELLDDEADFTVGAAYEHVLSNGYIGIKLPVSYTINNINKSAYFSPTLKFYPKRQGVVKYAVGPQFILAVGKITTTTFNVNKHVMVTENRSQLGFVLNNSLNFSVSKALYVGLEGGLGFRYYDSFKSKNGLNNNDIFFDSPINTMFFNFSFGVRF